MKLSLVEIFFVQVLMIVPLTIIFSICEPAVEEHIKKTSLLFML